ncbi:M67 family metallopeptidase [Rossellomorea sp. NPDC077527]|uniref:M67 family metallopeptidase n=1 Tax=Rossellomorea sp. NPDC077527 TaxID=3364510 RepID=UPI0037CB3FE8
MGLKKKNKKKWKRSGRSLNLKAAVVTHKEKVFISKVLFQTLIAECNKELPNEACGFISGFNTRCNRIWPTRNTNPSPYTFAIDLNDQDKILNEVKRNNEDFVGIYHSHPYGKAIPSEDDIKHAPRQNIYYFIIALERVNIDIRCYKISENKVKEVDIEIYG